MERDSCGRGVRDKAMRVKDEEMEARLGGGVGMAWMVEGLEDGLWSQAPG
jgi:hypothetical protein